MYKKEAFLNCPNEMIWYHITSYVFIYILFITVLDSSGRHSQHFGREDNRNTQAVCVTRWRRGFPLVSEHGFADRWN